MTTSALRSRPGIPIAAVGVWQTATGEWKCTPQQLEDAVRAQHDGAFRSPIVKVGHTDPRFTDGEILGDGEPAIGWLENLRLTDGGQTLISDWIGIPAPLDDVLAAAYPSRSIECMLGVETSAGARYEMVVTGLALLGVTPPAIESLGDIADLYGVPTDVASYVAASRIAASITQEVTMPVRALGRVVASASIEELCKAVEDWAEEQPMISRDVWVRDIYTDSVVLTAWDYDGDSTMWRVSWSEADGAFTFGAPVMVRPTYEPVPVEAPETLVAASAVPLVASDVVARRLHYQQGEALRSPRGRVVTAGVNPQESHVPISSALAERLGVPVDADDDAVLAAVEAIELKAKTPAPVEAQTQEGGPATTTPPPADIDIDQLVAAKVNAAIAAAQAPVLAALATQTSKVAAMEAEKATAQRDALIGSAITAGKIAPADRELWESQYDAEGGSAIVSSILASIPDGSRVPVTAKGHADGESTNDDDAFYAQIFGGQKAEAV